MVLTQWQTDRNDNGKENLRPRRDLQPPGRDDCVCRIFRVGPWPVSLPLLSTILAADKLHSYTGVAYYYALPQSSQLCYHRQLNGEPVLHALILNWQSALTISQNYSEPDVPC